MRDFRAFVLSHVAPLALAPQREQKIVEEWAAQLEEIYDALRADGLSDDEAWIDIEQQVRSGTLLSDRLLEDALEVAWLAGTPERNAPPDRTAVARGRVRAVRRKLREALATGVWRDLRGSGRMLFKNPGFSATVVLTLAICLGANAAIFTVVHDVLLRPLPLADPDRIVGMGDIYPTITPNDILSNDTPSYFDRREALTTLEEQGLFTFWFDTLPLDGVPQEVRGIRATPSLFRVLRAAPLLGRTFTDAEGEAGNDQKVILSYALWQRLFGGDPNVVGRPLRLAWNGGLYTIVGVMPPGFSFFDREYSGHAESAQGIQFWIPLSFTPEQKSDRARTRYGFFHVGRLRPGATVEQAQAQLDVLHAATVKRFPQFRYAELGMYSAVTPLQEALTRPIRRTLYLLWAGAGVVLLIGAFNVANLTLARAHARRRELATRVALGAGRLQVARQLIIEALLPAALGGAGGLAIGAAILDVLAASGALTNLPNATDARLQGTVVAVVFAAALAVGLSIGLVPAVSAVALAIPQALGDGSRSGTAGRAARFFRRGLVVAQVALSVVLLIGATLLFSSFRNLLNLDAGFDGTGVVTATIFPPPSRYPTPADVVALQDRVLDQVRAMPGVASAGFTSNIALSGFENPSSVSAAGRPEDDAVVPSVVTVTPGYFQAMSTPLIRGRYFDLTDRSDSAKVAIVDQRLAGKLWPNADPVGKAIYRGETGPFTIAGVVADVRLEGLASMQSIGTAYFPHTQSPPMRRLRWIALKSSVDPALVVRGLRQALLAIDPDLPLADVQTMRERTAHSVAPQQLAMSLSTMFAGIALLLSMLGLYSVLVGVVARRTREIGIRLALGDTVRGVFRLVLAEGAVLIGIGLMLGVAGAAAAAHTLNGLLFGVRPTDPVLFAAVTILTGAIALVACIEPARRATRVDPIKVLTQQ
jgi:putative ABC transport system permease protein